MTARGRSPHLDHRRAEIPERNREQRHVAVVRAYNDFLVDWHDVAPDRYVPLLTVPFWDLGATMVEMRRSAARGHAVSCSPAG